MASRTVSPGRARAFKLAALLLPFLLLLGAEGGLRLAGLGGGAPLFRRIGDMPHDPSSSLYLTSNLATRDFFFANPDRPGTLEETPLVMPKPPGNVRIMLLGESAMKGFPEPPCLASSSFLQKMLAGAWKDRTAEVINLGCTAIASYPVLELARQALDAQPDLLVLYVGNNEYFGAYGVASLNRAWSGQAGIRFQHWFRSTAISQGISRLLHHTGGAAGTDAPGKTLMETMMGQSFIATDDPMRAQAAANLGAFVGRIIELAHDRGVPVIVCTTPCNERDLAPLGEPDTAGMTPGDVEKTTDLLKQAQAEMDASPQSAVEHARAAAKLAPRHARARYTLGRAQYAAKQYPDAQASFREAITLDTMPWRPPASSVAALRRVAAEKGAVLCDLERAFEDESARIEHLPPGAPGSIGWELMDDHVHPTLRGQDLVARSILLAMKDVAGRAKIEAEPSLASFDDYAQALGDNPYERYGVAHTIRVLGKVGFIEKTNPGLYPRFDAVCSRIEEDNPSDVVDAMRKWQDPKSHPGAKRPISAMVGRVFLHESKPRLAVPLFQTAEKSVLPYSSWSLEYLYFEFSCRLALGEKLHEDDRARAQAAIDRGLFLLRAGPTPDGATEKYVGRLYQLRGEFRESIPYLVVARTKDTGVDLVAEDRLLVDAYMANAQPDKAAELIDYGEKHAGQYAPFYTKMRGLLHAAGEPATTGGASAGTPR